MWRYPEFFHKFREECTSRCSVLDLFQWHDCEYNLVSSSPSYPRAYGGIAQRGLDSHVTGLARLPLSQRSMRVKNFLHRIGTIYTIALPTVLSKQGFKRLRQLEPFVLAPMQ